MRKNAGALQFKKFKKQTGCTLKCLKCSQEFEALSKYNRLCISCSKENNRIARDRVSIRFH